MFLWVLEELKRQEALRACAERRRFHVTFVRRLLGKPAEHLN
jgi:hypothetical protein